MKGERIMQNEWIVISEYCDKCHIEPTFIDMLCESGLIDVEQEGSVICLSPSCRMWNGTAVCTTTFPSIWKGLMPSTICWQGWKRCSGRYTRCAAG